MKLGKSIGGVVEEWSSETLNARKRNTSKSETGRRISLQPESLGNSERSCSRIKRFEIALNLQRVWVSDVCHLFSHFRSQLLGRLKIPKRIEAYGMIGNLVPRNIPIRYLTDEKCISALAAGKIVCSHHGIIGVVE
jgi:hypothetical protein